MAERKTGVGAEDLARLSGDVDRWRRTRPKLSPMPALLWRRAIVLARELGINPVKSALGLNYNALRTRVEAVDEVVTSAATPPARFVELSGAQVLGVPEATGAVVELADAQGGRLTVRLSAGAGLDLPRLVEAFRKASA